MSKERGFAVISGSTAVVAKIMENGTVVFGQDKPVDMRVSGSLVLDLSGSTWGAGKVVQVDANGTASLGKVSAGNVLLGQTFTAPSQASLSSTDDVIDALLSLSSSIQGVSSSLGSGILNVSASDGTGTVNLASGQLKFASDSNITVTRNDTGDDVAITVDLNDNISVVNVTASTGVQTPKVKPASGDLTLEATNVKVVGALSSSGNITSAGNLTINGTGTSTIGGNLTVVGDLLVSGSTVVLEVSNLKVEDPIIVLGSSSAGSGLADGDRGFLFDLTGSNNRAFVWDHSDSVFKLGSTTDDGTGATLNVTADAELQLGTLKGSTLVSGSTVQATQLTASFASLGSVNVSSGLIVTGAVGLPNSVITNANLVNSSITVTAGNGLKTGGSVSLGGTVTVDLDLNELTSKSSLVAADSLAIVDSADSNASKKVTYSDLTGTLITSLAGTGLESSGGKLAVKYGSASGTAVQGSTTLTVSGTANEIEVGGLGSLFQTVTLGAPTTITIGLPDNVTISGSLTVNGNATLGDSSADQVTVNGKFQAPKFTALTIPAGYTSGDQTANNGHMFYLDAADDAVAAFPQGQKWYFCEDGVWHASNFFAV